MNLFQLLTPATYWLLIVIWIYILVFYIKRFRLRRVESRLFITLIAILAIDAFRTLFESVYFGAWYTSLAGFLPMEVHDFLVRPEMVFIPKILNVVAGVLVIGILLRRWLPGEEYEREQQEKHVRELTETIEKRRRAEEALRGAQEELIRKEKLAILGQLGGGVGHELRNPLGVISNAIYYLQTILPHADETTKEYLDMISSEVHSAEKIVSDLLDLSRTRPAEREEVAASQLVDQVLEKRPPPKKVKVATEIAPDLPPVLVDPRQIGQVLVNLVTNAYQAMPEGGRLIVKAQAEKEKVYLSITDTGCGISQENMKKLFEPLFTTRARGIGLGLAVSKNLVEVNGESIEVESEVGKGSSRG